MRGIIRIFAPTVRNRFPPSSASPAEVTVRVVHDLGPVIIRIAQGARFQRADRLGDARQQRRPLPVRFKLLLNTPGLVNRFLRYRQIRCPRRLRESPAC